jgi:hypothetical protein
MIQPQSSRLSLVSRMLRRAIIAAMCAVLVSGCSSLRLGYATAPTLVYWWLDKYVDFNGAQTTQVHDAIAQWFTWHRRGQVPEYATLLARAEVEVEADTTGARVCEWQTELIHRADTAFDRIAPAAADIVLTLTPDQIAHIEKRYAKVNEEFTDDYLQPDPAKRAAATLKRTVERAETLYGRLDKSQRARMAAALARSPFDPELWLAERRARQREALDLLTRLTRERATREQVASALRTYVDHIERSPREAYRLYWERLSEFNCGFAATLHNSMSPAQRNHAAKTLAGWQADLRSIAAKADSTPVE